MMSLKSYVAAPTVAASCKVCWERQSFRRKRFSSVYVYFSTALDKEKDILAVVGVTT